MSEMNTRHPECNSKRSIKMEWKVQMRMVRRSFAKDVSTSRKKSKGSIYFIVIKIFHCLPLLGNIESTHFFNPKLYGVYF